MWRRVAVVVLLVGSTLATSVPADAAVNLTYVHSKKRTMDAFSARTGRTARCPSGTQVIGGGGFVTPTLNGEASLGGSFPIDSGDADKRPDDGWRVFGNNNSPASTLQVQAWAVCADRGRYTYRTSPVTNVNNGAQASNIAICEADERVTGGGGSITGAHLEIELNGTIPEDVDIDEVFDNGWSAGFNNDSGVQQQFQAFAICAKGGTFSYTESVGTISGAGRFEHPVDCPDGEKVVSGGAFTSPSNNNVEMQLLHPFDDDDANKTPDDGWMTGAGIIVAPGTMRASRLVCR